VFLFLCQLLLSDSTGAISIARDPVKYELTKHIGVDIYYTQAHVQDGVIALLFSTCLQNSS
jgi:hypothetical protein